MIQGYWDFKHKEIPIWLSLFGGGLGLVFCFIEERDIKLILLSCAPGLIALLFSKITGEVIGYGDGIVFVVMGLFLPITKILAIGMFSFSLAGVVALILLVIFHKKGNYRIPFIPFLAIAYGVECFTGLGGIGG